MNEIVRSLDAITTEAKEIYERIKVDYARWGELMLEAKKLVPHGEWEDYLEKNFPMVGQRQARRYMQMVKEDKTLAQVTSRGTVLIPKRTLSPVAPSNPEPTEEANVLTHIATQIRPTLTLERAIDLFYRGLEEAEQDISEVDQIHVDALVVKLLRVIEAGRKFANKVGKGTHLRAIGD